MHIHVHIHLGFHRGANLPVYSGLPFQFETFKSLSKTQVLKHTQVFVIVFLKHVMHHTFPEFRTRLSTLRSALHLQSMRDQLLFTIHQYPFNMEPYETAHYHTMEPYGTAQKLSTDVCSRSVFHQYCHLHYSFSQWYEKCQMTPSATHLPVMFVFGMCVCVQKRKGVLLIWTHLTTQKLN